MIAMNKLFIILIFNIYFFSLLKIQKKQIVEKSFSLDDSLIKNIIIFLFNLILFFFLLREAPLLFSSCILLISFFLRKCYITFYYKIYSKNRYLYLFNDIELYLYKYQISPKKKQKLFLIIIIYYYIIILYCFNIITFIIAIVFYSFYDFYNFDQTFDDAFFYKYNGYDILLKEKGLKKIEKYKKYILDPNNTVRDKYECYFNFGTDFIFLDSNNNELFLKGCI